MLFLANLVKSMGNPSYLLFPLFPLKILFFVLSTSLSILLCISLLSRCFRPNHLEKDYFRITFCSDLMCNKILMVIDLCVWVRISSL